MKKILGIVALVVVLMLTFVGCNNNENQGENNLGNNNVVENQNQNPNQNNQENEKVVVEPVNKSFSIEEELNTIQPLTGLEQATKMSETEISTNYNFGKYEDLQMEIRSLESGENFKEIAIIKIGETDQSMDLFQIMIKRLTALKEKYKDNEKVLGILNDSKNMILKQQGGVLIFIVAENAKEIEAELDKSFM